MIGLPPFLGIWRWEGLCTRGGHLKQTVIMRHVKAERANQVKITQFSTDVFNELLQVIFFLLLFTGFPSAKCYHGHCGVTLICLYNL